MSANVTCNDCKHAALDEEEAPCRYCEGKDKFEVPCTTYDYDQLIAERDRYKAALERIATDERSEPWPRRVAQKALAEAVRE